MLDLIREVLQCAERDRFLRRISRVPIRLSEFGKNDLRVTFRAESSRFE
jgi:hypothetical protein